MDGTEPRYSVPESVLEHLWAAHDTAGDEDALYHLREAIQIAESEVEAVADIEEVVE
ncbi:hypothetical protein [Haloarcula laminariae]|uniref:hypothetical protein n=1 Tax=Haloarcula laminariae TaxID=2961577 RepID=UPI0021C861B1|nr:MULTISPECIES: hypothetical protein [Halomicroarcula]